MSSLSSQPKVLTDEPKWSSASLSITLNHLGNDFRPEYTHQLVGDECWRGYRPLESVLRKANADYKNTENCKQSRSDCKSILHKSHRDHDTASSELEIRILLSPSCQKCCVDVVRSESDRSEHCSGSEGQPDAKRRKTDCGPDGKEKLVSSPNSVTFNMQGQNVNETLSSSELASKLPMKNSEIMDALCKALPPIISQNENTNKVEDCFLSDPIGDILEEYSVSVRDKTVDDNNPSSINYVLTIADGRSANVSDYHQSVQKLSLFYIENADSVDVANDAEDPGLILRVCQALILPPFQGQGHGRRLLQNVYKLAHGERGKESTSDGDTDYDIVQVNVEDPAPAFVALRNKLDYQFLLEHRAEWEWPEKGSIWCAESSNTLALKDNLSVFCSAMTEKEASEISVKAKIIPKQIHVANELFKLKAIQEFSEKYQDSMSDSDKDTIERLFRLMVKRRLNKEHRDELMEQPTKDDQKVLLAKLFDRELLGYERILWKT